MSEKIYTEIDFNTIEKLADILNEKNLGEITVGEGECMITVKAKKCPPPPPAMNVPAFVPEQTAPKADAKPSVDGNVVKSPIVGTFYAASSPDKAPFVTVGQQVKQGDVLFIIESMKVMNEVLSEFSGTVKQIMVSNADAVEYDQPVMIIG